MRKLLAVSVLLAVPAFEGCVSDSTTADDAYLQDIEKTGGTSQKWIYEGLMPPLEQPAIVVSLKSHTARVTGLLPADFPGPLPFYAKTDAADGGRTRVTVVYPVASGAVDPSTGKAPMAPGHYPRLYGVPFTPTTDKAAWGGFPFLMYNATRGLAFHGPITAERNADTGDWEWLLKRGPVSHGCERMQGEHVVELAHMLGMKMDHPHATSDRATVNVSVDVITTFDTYDGQLVDVDYPALPAVARPSGNVVMFPTWDSRRIPNQVCAYDPKRPLDGHHCDNVGVVKQDILTGEITVPDDAPPSFIGSTCAADSDCNFDAGGATPRCERSGAHGYCTVPCEGYCTDLAGAAPTFCGKLPSGKGACMSKAAPENNGCADIPGTSARQVSRYVGASGAAAKVATACSF